MLQNIVSRVAADCILTSNSAFLLKYLHFTIIDNEREYAWVCCIS